MHKKYAFVQSGAMVVWVFFFILLLSACDALYSKDNYLNDYRCFVLDVRKNCAAYTEKDWELADKKYVEFSDQLYMRFKRELTDRDKYLIGRLNGLYSMLRLKKEAGQMYEDAKDIINGTKGIFDGSVEGMK